MLPLMSDGTLPPVAFLLHWLASRRAAVIQLDRLPAGNGSIPDLLSQAGVTTLQLTRNPVGRPFRWEGWNGGRVLVDATTGQRRATVRTTDTSWTPTYPLANGHLYRWRVVAQNELGHGLWSPPTEFRVTV